MALTHQNSHVLFAKKALKQVRNCKPHFSDRNYSFLLTRSLSTRYNVTEHLFLKLRTTNFAYQRAYRLSFHVVQRHVNGLFVTSKQGRGLDLTFDTLQDLTFDTLHQGACCKMSLNALEVLVSSILLTFHACACVSMQ